MAWNGSGTFSRTNGTATGSNVWAQDKAASRKITSTLHDNHDEDLATAINNCLAKDGQNAMTGNLNMGAQDITNINQITGTVTFTDTVLFGTIGPNSISDVSTIISEGSGCTLTGLYIFDAPIVFNEPVQFNEKLTSAELVVTSEPPANASATGTTGRITWDSDYMYVCVATNTWKRTTLATW